MISPLDSRVMDANAEALGINVETLMGNAGRAIAQYLSENHPGKRIGFFCGHGNNGGDGFAAATHLPKNLIEVYTITDREKINSPVVKRYLESVEVPTIPFEKSTFDFDILVDCGLGTGISGKLRPDYEAYVNKANDFKGIIISIDIPTGFGTETCIKADCTITMHDLKEGMTEENCGKIIVADISMPTKAYTHTGPGDMLRYPIPKPDSHKGSNGCLLIIGGGPYFGAPAMSGMAALRVGTDLVTIATPESSYHEIASVNPTLMVGALPGNHLNPHHLPILKELAEKCNAVLIGPGLGKDPETAEAVKEFIKVCKKPIVVDADGLNSLGKGFHSDNPHIIFTPHAKEFERLGGTSRTIEGVTLLSNTTNATIVLKGKTDIICNGNRSKYNETGCAGMTGAGTGDVLAGTIAGLLSKNIEPFDAATLGTYICGKSGELAFEQKSYGMIATDVIEMIPAVLKDGLKGRKN